MIARLTAVPGIGAWTAQLFLIFSLGRGDVIASGDLGIRRAVMIAYGLPEMPTPAEVDDRAHAWSPYRTLAGLLLGFVFLFFRQGVVNAVQFVTGQNLWDPSIRYLTELPSKTDPFEVTAIVAMALLMSFLATLYPALKAASTDPVQVLRYE